MIVTIEAEFKNPKIAKKILEPELASDNRMRSKVKINYSGKKLKIIIDSKDVNAARAATNTYLKLIGLIKNIGDT